MPVPQETLSNYQLSSQELTNSIVSQLVLASPLAKGTVDMGEIWSNSHNTYWLSRLQGFDEALGLLYEIFIFLPS